MVYLMVQHRVENFQSWKKSFDQDEKILREAGCLRFGIYQSEQLQNNVTLFLEWDSTPNAKKFIESDRLKTIMKETGVIGEPQFHFLSLAEKKVLKDVNQAA